MKRKKKVLITIFIVFFGVLFVIPAIAFCILNWYILPPEKLTPLVVEEVNKHIDGQLECEHIELTFFSTYPQLGVRILKGQVVSHAVKDTSLVSSYDSPTDSLLNFQEATLSINPLDYVFSNKINIAELTLDSPRFYGFINEEGVANWNIYTSATDTEKVEEVNDTTALPAIDVKRLRIRDGHFIFDNRQGGIYAETEGFFLRVSGSLAGDGNNLSIASKSSSMYFESPDYTLNNKLTFQFKSKIDFTKGFQTITLKDAEMQINHLPFTADGTFNWLPDSKSLYMDVKAGLQASDLNELIHFIPDRYLPDRKKIQAAGSIRLETHILGELGDSISPTIDALCILENGSYFMKGSKQGIESLALNMDIHLDGKDPRLSHVALEKLQLTGMNTSVDVYGRIDNIFHSPYIDTKVKGKIDLTKMAKDFLDPDTFLLSGFVDADLQTSFLLDDVLQARYNNIRALGRFTIDSLRAFSHPYEVDMFVKGADFLMDSAKVTSGYIAGDDLINGALNIDTMRVIYKENINTHLSGMKITAKTSPTIDSTAVMSVTSHIKIDRLRTRLPDSVWIVAKNTYLRGGIKPSASNKQIPQIGASVTVDSLRYFDIPSRMGAVLDGSTFNLEALPYRDAMRQRYQSTQQRDTTGRAARIAARRNRGGRAARTAADSLSSSQQLLRNWEVRGSVLFNQMRLFSRMFPLPMRMEKTKVKFDTNNMHFTDAVFHAGKSSFKLNGEVSSMRTAYLRGGKLKGKFSVSSDYIDCNQLLQAINRGMQFMEQQEKKQATTVDDENLVTMDANALQDSIQGELADMEDMLFVVPPFLDMSLVLNAKEIDYKDLNMSQVEGEVVLRNQSINLKKFNMDSNIGKGSLNMFYAAKDRTKANVGFDLDMENILVEKLIDLYPPVDTLLPMLRSFEGVVGCQLAATCEIDSTSFIVLPSVYTSCHLDGKDMVLLDGETFAEISKTLMFKNKKKNVIENISVDLTVDDGKIEIYPFLVEIDRYRVAVGGTHNLDMTFNYHVSVLKSPVPFKLGIDVTGDLDNPKFKIVKCRYKDIFKPARIKDLNAEPANLRKELREHIRNQIIGNAPELAVVEAP